MTFTLNLSDEQATVLQAKAAAEGISLEEWIQNSLNLSPHQAAERSSACDTRY